MKVNDDLERKLRHALQAHLVHELAETRGNGDKVIDAAGGVATAIQITDTNDPMCVIEATAMSDTGGAAALDGPRKLIEMLARSGRETTRSMIERHPRGLRDGDVRRSGGVFYHSGITGLDFRGGTVSANGHQAHSLTVSAIGFLESEIIALMEADKQKLWPSRNRHRAQRSNATANADAPATSNDEHQLEGANA